MIGRMGRGVNDRKAGVRKNRKRANRFCRADNRGVSFVEVIVSMLILAIAVIPLLGCFMMSLKVNAKSRQAMSATIVAQNVMECVKEYAKSDVKIEDGSGIEKYLPDTYAESFSPTSTYGLFTLSNVREGVNDYYVEIKYDQSAFQASDKSGINDQEIPDLTTLDADSTVVVCPSGVVNGGLESAAKTYFLEEWVTRQWANHQKDEEPYTGPNEAERAAARSEIASKMTSKLMIKVSNEAAFGMAVKPKVKVLLRYEYDGMTYSAYSYEGSADLDALGKINVYVFYDPLQIVGDSSGGYQITDTIVIENESKLSWNLFFAVQETDVCLDNNSGIVEAADKGKLSGPVFERATEDIFGEIGLYCSTKIENTGHSLIKNMQSFVKRVPDERMQRVTVKVYRQGTDDLLASMETDIVQ